VHVAVGQEGTTALTEQAEVHWADVTVRCAALLPPADPEVQPATFVA
jgi:hypothetical protein